MAKWNGTCTIFFRTTTKDKRQKKRELVVWSSNISTGTLDSLDTSRPTLSFTTINTFPYKPAMLRWIAGKF